MNQIKLDECPFCGFRTGRFINLPDGMALGCPQCGVAFHDTSPLHTAGQRERVMAALAQLWNRRESKRVAALAQRQENLLQFIAVIEASENEEFKKQASEILDMALDDMGVS